MKENLDDFLKYHLIHSSVISLKTDDFQSVYEDVLNYLLFNWTERVFDNFNIEINEVKFKEIKELQTKTIIYIKSEISNISLNSIINTIPDKSLLVYYANENNLKINELYNLIKLKSLKIIIITSFEISNIYIKQLEIPLPEMAKIQKIVKETFQQNNVNASVELTEQVSNYLTGLPVTYIKNSLEYAIYYAKEKKSDFFQALLKQKKLFFKFNLSMEFIENVEDINYLGGQNALKQWLKERQKAFSPKAKQLGIPYPKGMLLVGIQGCGKSLTAKAIANLWKLPLLKMDFSLLFTSNKTPEETFKENLLVSENLSPVILWLDEIDKLFAATVSSSSELKRIFGTFLTWLQEKTNFVFVVATANKIDDIPPELLRKGRFDEIFFIDLPNEHEREDIFKIHLKKRNINYEQFNLKSFAKRTEHFSGSEIEQIVISSLYRAFYETRTINEKDVVYTIEQTIPFYTTYEEEIKKLKHWAETKARKASENTELYDLFNK